MKLNPLVLVSYMVSLTFSPASVAQESIQLGVRTDNQKSKAPSPKRFSTHGEVNSVDPVAAPPQNPKAEQQGEARKDESNSKVAISHEVCQAIEFTSGKFSASIENHLDVPIYKVQYVVVIYDEKKQPIDSKEGCYFGIIQPGLAKQIIEYVPSLTRRTGASAKILSYEKVGPGGVPNQSVYPTGSGHGTFRSF